MSGPATAASGVKRSRLAGGLGLVVIVAGLAYLLLSTVHGLTGNAPAWFWAAVGLVWGAAALAAMMLSAEAPPTTAGRSIVDLAIPILFGATILFLWEVITVGAGVPKVLMPSPSAIAERFAGSLPMLGEDFVQTVLRAVIPGWALGSLIGFLVALLCDRIPFVARGLIPIGNFVSALPMIGVAPIMVMWFGFDWPSKVAIVVIMTFFPALVNGIAGLQASGYLERDLMRSYGATYAESLIKLRLPAAMPFVFNALKINSTLAMIGAIVAEFFGTPIVGMGFRISTEVGRSDLDMVWAEIALAAVTGSAFYGLLALAERLATFWHPSMRGR
jgi:NitT/TauT family transport system permease protein